MSDNFVPLKDRFTILILCMLGIFSCFVVICNFAFKINVFKKKSFTIRVPNCLYYQQTTKVAASK